MIASEMQEMPQCCQNQSFCFFCQTNPIQQAGSAEMKAIRAVTEKFGQEQPLFPGPYAHIFRCSIFRAKLIGSFSSKANPVGDQSSSKN